MPNDKNLDLVTSLEQLTPERRRQTDRRSQSVPVLNERRRDSRRQARQLKPIETFTGVAIVVDSNPLFSEGIKSRLQEAGMRIASCDRSVKEALKMVGDRLDLVVIGNSKEPDTEAIELIESTRTRNKMDCSTAVLLILDQFSPQYVRDKLQCGVQGIVERSISISDFQASIARLLSGDRVLSGKPLAALATTGLEPAAQCEDEQTMLLTKKEFEVLTHLALHLSNKEIADLLFISEGTIKTHCSNIYAKLQVPGRREAILAAVERGLLR